jgi:hypothetical protein
MPPFEASDEVHLDAEVDRILRESGLGSELDELDSVLRSAENCAAEYRRSQDPDAKTWTGFYLCSATVAASSLMQAIQAGGGPPTPGHIPPLQQYAAGASGLVRKLMNWLIAKVIAILNYLGGASPTSWYLAVSAPPSISIGMNF